MPTFRRRPLWQRCNSFRFHQPVRAIDVTDETIAFLFGKHWHRVHWHEITHATLHRMETWNLSPKEPIGVYRDRTPEEVIEIMEQRRERGHNNRANTLLRYGVHTIELLKFKAKNRSIRINLTDTAPHFFHNHALRTLLQQRIRFEIAEQRIGRTIVRHLIFIAIAVCIYIAVAARILADTDQPL